MKRRAVFKEQPVHCGIQRIRRDLFPVQPDADGKEAVRIRVDAVNAHHGGKIIAARGKDLDIGVAHILRGVRVMRRRIAAVGQKAFPVLAIETHGGLIHYGKLFGERFAEFGLLAEIKRLRAGSHGIRAVGDREVHDGRSNARARERAARRAGVVVLEKIAQRVVHAVFLRRGRDGRVGFLGHCGGFRRRGRRGARRLGSRFRRGFRRGGRRCRCIAGCCGGLLRLRGAGGHKRRA